MFYTKYFVKKLTTISYNFFFITKFISIFYNKKTQNKIDKKYKFFLVALILKKLKYLVLILN